jgi:hypothetical protein
MNSTALFFITYLCALDGTMCFEQHSRVPDHVTSTIDADTTDWAYNIRACALFYGPIAQKNKVELKVLRLERFYCQYERYSPDYTVRYDLVTGRVTSRLDTVNPK